MAFSKCENWICFSTFETKFFILNFTTSFKGQLIFVSLSSQTFSRMKKLHVAIFIIKTTLQPHQLMHALAKCLNYMLEFFKLPFPHSVPLLAMTQILSPTISFVQTSTPFIVPYSPTRLVWAFRNFFRLFCVGENLQRGRLLLVDQT